MPSVARKGVVGKYLELPPELWERVVELAGQNRRPVREEIMHALERHLSAPPVCTYRLDTPEVAPAEVVAQAQAEEQTARRGRGRPRGTTKT